MERTERGEGREGERWRRKLVMYMYMYMYMCTEAHLHYNTALNIYMHTYLPANLWVFLGQDVLGEGRGLKLVLVKRKILNKQRWGIDCAE